MLRWKLRFALVAFLCLVPYVILMGMGCWALYERGLFTWFAIAATAISLFGWNLDRIFRVKKLKPIDATIDSLGAKGEAGAREAIDKIALRVESKPPAFDDSEAWKRLAIEVFDTVALKFGRTSAKPALEITVPDAMLIGERVLHDLRLATKAQVPGSHVLTIRQLEQLTMLWKNTSEFTSASSPWRLGYRIIRFVMNPVSGVFKEANDNLLGDLSVTAFEEAKRWAIGYSVRRVGEYAIQLYSGQLAIHEGKFQEFQSPVSSADHQKAARIETLQDNEPLRIMVLGQAKAGKSSLVNAIFGEVRAATDSLPCTTSITPYVLERDGLPKAILFDTEGFGGKEDRRAVSRLDRELVQCDLIIMVCSAVTAARSPDLQLLSDLRERFASNKLRSLPPVVVAVTHIDQLRPFAEWNPPYDLRDENSTKARNIAAVIATLETELTVPSERIVPICLRQESNQNVMESLIPVLLFLLPEADRAKLLRLLREYHASEYWSQLRSQAYQTGLLLRDAAVKVAGPLIQEAIKRMK